MYDNESWDVQLFSIFFFCFVVGNSAQCISKDCWSCVESSDCVWCLSSNQCTSNSSCFGTPYTDCCYTYPSCQTCTGDQRCSFCQIGSVMMCQENSTIRGCFQDQHYCPTNPTNIVYFVRAFLLGLFLTIGSSFLILSVILLFTYIYRRHKRLSAQAEINKLYLEKRAVNKTIAEIETKYKTADSYTTLAPLINRMRVDR